MTEVVSSWFLALFRMPLTYVAKEPSWRGGGSQEPPPHGGGKSRGPPGRGLNNYVLKSVCFYTRFSTSSGMGICKKKKTQIDSLYIFISISGHEMESLSSRLRAIRWNITPCILYSGKSRLKSQTEQTFYRKDYEETIIVRWYIANDYIISYLT